MSNTDSIEGLEQEIDAAQSPCLERPLEKTVIQRLPQESLPANPEPEPPVTENKVKTVVLPALLISGLGVLAIVYPHFLDDFDLHYIRGNDFSVIFIFLFVLLIKLSWNQVGGSVAITLSLLAIARCFLPANLYPNKPDLIEHQPSSESTQKTLKQDAIHLGLKTGMRVGKNISQQRRSRHSQEKVDSSL